MATVPNPVPPDRLQAVESADRLYWPQLDGLRSIAFGLVFVSHLHQPPPLPNSLLLGNGITMANTLAQWGWIGVDLFFVLSAFLITTLLLKEREQHQTVSFRMFFIRRVLRIWPLYYFFILFGLFIIPLTGFACSKLGSEAWNALISNYLAPYLFFVMNFSLIPASTPLIATFQAIPWSVCIEEQFYLVWGLILSRVQKTSTLLWLATSGFVGTFLIRWLIWLNTDNYRAYYYNSFSHLDPIMIGIALAVLVFTGRFNQGRLEKYGLWLFWVPVAGYFSMSLLCPPLESDQFSSIFLFSISALLCGMFLLGILYGKVGQTLCSHPLLVRVGRLTYGMYMLHLLGIQLAVMITNRLAGPILDIASVYSAWAFYATLSLLITWLMAFISWHLLEKRFYNLRYRFSRVPSGFGA